MVERFTAQDAQKYHPNEKYVVADDVADEIEEALVAQGRNSRLEALVACLRGEVEDDED